MKNICIVTSTRADFGLLRPLINKIECDNDLNLLLVATGMHLSEEFGLTYKEIESNGNIIDQKIETMISSDLPSAMTKSMALTLFGFSDYFNRKKPDLLIVLGDRYEILAVCIAAMNEMIPIAHLHGGEATEGLIDEAVRHSISKMSYLHFTSTEQYRQRVINMGEAPARVFNVGATGVENILSMTLMAKDQLARSIDFDLNSPFALVTLHPVTLEKNTATKQIEELLSALDETNGLNYVFTKANADANGRVLNKRIDAYCEGKEKGKAIAFTSMGVLRYLSAMKYCEMVIGNSSSGIMETPSFKKPTINIGDRQKGRIFAKSVIACKSDRYAIIKSIEKARSQQFSHEISDQVSPYGDGKTSEKVIAVIKDFLNNDKISLKKSFYDVRKGSYF